MNMLKKIFQIFLNALPVILMIAFIPVEKNDYLLTAIYVVIIVVALAIKKEYNDMTVFFFGLIVLTISEYFFVQTGVERFTRHTLLGVMPLWLPFLWAYAFVAIKRSIHILEM